MHARKLDAALRTLQRKGHEAELPGKSGRAAQKACEKLGEFIELDRMWKGRTTSNKELESPSDPDALEAGIVDGATDIAHKAEHAADA